MKKKIYLNTVLLSTVMIVLVSMLICLVVSIELSAFTFSIVFKRAIPFIMIAVLFTCLISYPFATGLTKRLLEPLNKIEFDDWLEPPYDEVVPFIRAINHQRAQINTQRKEIEGRTDLVHSIIENMNEGAALIDQEGMIISANRSALRIFGAMGDLSGRNIRELFRDSVMLEHTQEALKGRRKEMTMDKIGRDFTVYFSPVSDSGAILLFLDTTEKTKADKIRREFSANVSHELKTPLTSITGYAEMLGSGMVEDEKKEDFIIKIRDEAKRLITLVEDIMMISKLDEGRADEFFDCVDLTEVAGEVIKSLELKAEDAGVKVTLILEEKQRYLIKASRSMIEEMFSNLIDNAIKYNKKDGEVTVKLTKTDKKIIASVSDTGIGIPEEAQSRVFERFYRVDQSRSKMTGGTGLGLAIVKHIALSVGADIDLESKKDIGTDISVAFPLR